MGFNLESSKNDEFNEVPAVEVDSEQLSETEETVENFDDCSLNEVQDSKGNEVNAESLEDAEENFDDCEAEMEKMDEKNPELAEEDDFNDCGKETEGQYVAEVTYTTDGEISQGEAGAELQDAYNECDDPEDMQQLKENANENEHIEVHNAEIVESPENGVEISEEEYEQTKEELEEAQETLEAQQEAAQEYSDDLKNQINKQENEVPEGTENIDNDSNEVAEDDSEEFDETKEESENTEAVENIDEGNDFEVEEKYENVDETGGHTKESEEANDIANQENQEVDSEGEQVEGEPKKADEIPEDVESIESKTEQVEEETENIESDDLEQMDGNKNVEAPNIDEENVGENISRKVEEETDTELSDETKEKIKNDVSESIDNEAEDGKISAEETEKIIDNNIEENIDNVEEQKEAIDEKIDNRADEIVENEDLTDEDAKEQIYDEIAESSNETPSNEEFEAIVEEKTNDIDEAIEEKKDEKESVEAIEKTVEELEHDQVEQSLENETKSLQERIEDALDKDEVSSAEISGLREENNTEIKSKIVEKEATEAELKSKFDEVLSKEKESEEYKQTLQEYNVLQDQKANLSGQISAMEKQQELLDKKSLELRDAQIQKGVEVATTSAVTLAGVNALQERYDQIYYDKKTDKTELASIREESCSVIKELTKEKESVKQAMDAKMDEIAEYVTSNNMDRYDTAHDLRYQQLSAEYNAMKESHDRMGYSIVKLDENNKAITEQLGDEYVSMVELPYVSRILEVNTGTDMPGETDYFVDEAKALEVLSPFKQDNWEQLSFREQKQAVEKLADYNAEILGIEDKPQIAYYKSDDPSDFGGYSAKQNAIYINENNMHDAAETADTISHEYRHKYQHERAEKLETERDLEYKEGFDNYIRAEDDYQGYKNQLVEVDARAYAEVIQNKINESVSDVYNDEVVLSTVDGTIQNYSEINPEKGAVFRNNAEKGAEFSKDKTNNEILERTFTTNDGETISYNEAINRIVIHASKYMDSLDVDTKTKTAVINDITNELISQQKFAEARLLGDHGIRHLYGNIERSESYLDSRESTDDATKLAVLVSHIYHDHGYTDADVHNRDASRGDRTETFNPNEPGKKFVEDKDHDLRSLEFFHSEKRDLYEQVFQSNLATVDSIEQAIGYHNTPADKEYIKGTRNSDKKDIAEYWEAHAEQINDGTTEVRTFISSENTDGNIIVKSVLISDKLALTQREKFSEFLHSYPEMVTLTEGMNQVSEYLKNNPIALAEYRNEIKSYVGNKYLEKVNRNYSELNDEEREYLNGLLHAVDTDMGFNSAKFNTKMNYIYVPSNSHQYIKEDGENIGHDRITIGIIDRPDAQSQDLRNGQVIKMLEDMGVDSETAKSYISEFEKHTAPLNSSKAFFFIDTHTGIEYELKSMTDDEIKMMEGEKFQTNDDLTEVNERIENGRQAFKEFSNRMLEVTQIKESRDISYDEYLDIVSITETPFDVISEEEYDALIKQDKNAGSNHVKNDIDARISVMVKNQTKQTLYVNGGK